MLPSDSKDRKSALGVAKKQLLEASPVSDRPESQEQLSDLQKRLSTTRDQIEEWKRNPLAFEAFAEEQRQALKARHQQELHAAKVRAARAILGLSAAKFAQLLKVGGGPSHPEVGKRERPCSRSSHSSCRSHCRNTRATVTFCFQTQGVIWTVCEAVSCSPTVRT